MNELELRELAEKVVKFFGPHEDGDEEVYIPHVLGALKRVATNTAIRTSEEAADDVSYMALASLESDEYYRTVGRIERMLRAKAAALQNASPTKEK